MLMIIYRLLGNLPIPKKIYEIGETHLGVLVRMAVMFGFVSLGWVFFRVSSIEQAFYLIANISLTPSRLSATYINDLIFFGLPLLLVQIWQVIKGDLLVVAKLRFPVQLVVNTLIVVWIIVFGTRQVTEFIYTQF
jgi:hypothetical protein